MSGVTWPELPDGYGLDLCSEPGMAVLRAPDGSAVGVYPRATAEVLEEDARAHASEETNAREWWVCEGGMRVAVRPTRQEAESEAARLTAAFGRLGMDRSTE